MNKYLWFQAALHLSAILLVVFAGVPSGKINWSWGVAFCIWVGNSWLGVWYGEKYKEF